MMHTLMQALTRVVTTHPHWEKSRPEIQGPSGRKWGTQVKDDPPFPKWLLSRNGVTIEP